MMYAVMMIALFLTMLNKEDKRWMLFKQGTQTMKNYNGENNTMPHAYFPSDVSGTVDVEGADGMEEPRHKEGQEEKQMGEWTWREMREKIETMKKMMSKNSKDKRREEEEEEEEGEEEDEEEGEGTVEEVVDRVEDEERKSP